MSFDERYRTKTNDELIRLAMDSEQLSPEAQTALRNQLSTRRITERDVQAFREDQKNSSNDKKSWNPHAVNSLWPGVGRFRITLNDWRKYRRQNGKWPFLSIAYYFSHIFAELIGLATILWYCGRNHWSKGKFLLLILPLITIDVLVSNRLERKIRMIELVRYRHQHDHIADRPTS